MNSIRRTINLGDVTITELFLALPEKEIVFWKSEKKWHLSFGKYDSIDTPKNAKEGVGFFSYDFNKQANDTSQASHRPVPHFEWRKYHSKITQEETGLLMLHCPKEEWGKTEKYLKKFQIAKKQDSFSIGKFIPLSPKKTWREGFRKTKENIFSGEIYQLNLTRQFSADFEGNPRALFLYYAQKNPAPHTAFFGGKGYNILSYSPELFLRFEKEKVTTEPIKGTRPRQRDSKKDEAEKKSLIDSKKEAAELLMITDLLRNDIKKTCCTGSIKLESLREIQKNPTVWHTLSRISGRRKPEYSAIDTLLSCLPGGSISGCPKKRAAEIIDEIEPHSRGIFCGTFGFLDAEQNGTFSILIRTLLHKDKKIYFQAGGGITADSEQEAEYEELMQKGKVFFEK
jgi:anthranilate/para-aminobenzoate synthase component I